MTAAQVEAKTAERPVAFTRREVAIISHIHGRRRRSFSPFIGTSPFVSSTTKLSDRRQETIVTRSPIASF